MTLIEILNKKVSYQDHLWSETTEITLRSALDKIKGETLRLATDSLRRFYINKDFANYDKNKRNLPGVTFCGYFYPKRSGDCLKIYNDLVVIDIDKLGEEELERVKKVLAADEYVFSFWESPSKNGIKGLVSLAYQFNINVNEEDCAHKIAFKQLVDYFSINYDINLDTSGSDITRLCFLSYDLGLVLKNDIRPFEVEESAPSSVEVVNHQIRPIATNNANLKNILENPDGRNNPFHRKIISSIIEYLNNKQLSITYKYDSWLRVGFAIANSFTYGVGEKYYLALSKMDVTKYDEPKCKQMLKNCYLKSKGKVKFNSIVVLATEKGFMHKDLVRGVPKAAGDDLSASRKCH